MLLAVSRVGDCRVEDGVLGLKHTWKPELQKREQWSTCQKQFMQTSDFSQLREEGKCDTVLSLAVRFS